MERIAVLVASSPTSASAERAFQLIRDLSAQGHAVTLGLLEDGVLAAAGGLPEVPLAACAAVKVLAGDLALRGMAAGSLRPGCQPCEYGDLVDLLMEQSDRTLGVF
ncbi:MAG TPA: DsrH/TusB family sulfur metabolism protein [Symbiobacteriaceae bacterium]|jgi:sulfur relay protein TusB/DsrH